MPIVIQNERLLPYMKDRYRRPDVGRLRRFLAREGTLRFTPLRTGLFPAATAATGARTGYHHVWVRDNVHLCHAFFLDGDARAASRIMSSLMRYFCRYRRRFEAIIEGRGDPADAMSRPHVRFSGVTLRESGQVWAHAQNDALGYFLWMYGRLALAGAVSPSREEIEALLLFPQYFDAIRYWEDEDSGHWEETRKIQASSIGPVVAGLQRLRTFLQHGGGAPKAVLAFTKRLEERGRQVLNKILPSECIQRSPAKRRRFDAALMFLVYPLEVITGRMADRILTDVADRLEGPFGIRRYPGDSYWSADYKEKMNAGRRTADFSASVVERDKLLAPGQEAQWCLFDPIMSAAYGRRYQRTGSSACLRRQTYYFNRSLGQLTAAGSEWEELRCPEAYYLRQGRYEPNDQTPLLWTQANLLTAFNLMERSLSLADAGPARSPARPSPRKRGYRPEGS